MCFPQDHCFINYLLTVTISRTIITMAQQGRITPDLHARIRLLRIHLKKKTLTFSLNQHRILEYSRMQDTLGYIDHICSENLHSLINFYHKFSNQNCPSDYLWKTYFIINYLDTKVNIKNSNLQTTICRKSTDQHTSFHKPSATQNTLEKLICNQPTDIASFALRRTCMTCPHKATDDGTPLGLHI